MATNATANKKEYAEMHQSARLAITILTMQFLLGMGVNLIGLPSETSGVAKTVSSLLLGLHVLVALGMLIGAVKTFMAARKLTGQLHNLSWAGGTAIILTFAAGVLTMITKSNWWSYCMAAGFITVLLIYVAIYARTATR